MNYLYRKGLISSSSTESSSSDGEQSSTEESDEEIESVIKPHLIPKTTVTTKTESTTNTVKSNLDLLMDLGDIPVTPVMTPSLGGFLTPLNTAPSNTIFAIQVIAPNFVSTRDIELLNRISGRGLTITYRFTRTPHLFSSTMVNIALLFTNATADNITNIKLGQKVGINRHCRIPF